MATDNEESLERIRQDINRKSSESSQRPMSPNNETLCELCSGTGYISTDRGVIRCECQKQKIILQKLAAIPARFRNSTFANYDPINGKQVRAKERISSEFTKSYYIFGPYGTGKTHLGTAQYVQLVRIERPCLFLSMGELMNELRRSELEQDTYYCQVREKCRYAERFHLFIDDMDKFKPTDFKAEALFDLIDTIYKRNIGLTITSNYSLSELAAAQTIHPSVLRRIDDICEVIEL
jgi:DNA replication protein DnaC